MELFKIPNVEIFSVGKHNGNEYTEEKLDKMVEAYKATNETIPVSIKLGHPDEQRLLSAEEEPAAGWVENIRREGKKLVADFVDIPKKIYQLIQTKGYRKVSCEIYRDVEVEETTYPRLIGGVALLGATLPGVLNLSDILSRYKYSGVENFELEGSVAIISNEHKNHEDDEMPTVEELKAELEAKNAALAKANSERDDFKSKADAAEKEKAESAKALLEAKQKEKAAQVDKFATELQAEKLISKAMVPFVKELMGDEKETYSIGEDKNLSKQDVLKKVLKFAKEGAKVNFKDETGDAKPKKKDLQSELNAKIEKYSKDNKVSYAEAYKVVAKDVDLSVDALEAVDEDSDDE